MNNKIAILGELTYFGMQRDKIHEGFNQTFGEKCWDIKWFIDNKIISQLDAIQHYEDGYLHFLTKNKDVLDWLISTASEVYDIAPSNIKSGLDYRIQECNATHLQDIAVRRVLARLGQEFQGDHPIQIRDHNSKGYILNPGKVPFHKPESILERDIKSWWDKYSVEDFYQSNKALLVDPEKLIIQPDVISPEGTYFKFNKSTTYLPDKNNPHILHRFKGKEIRAKTHSEPEKYKQVRRADAKPIPYAQLLS